MTYDPTYGTVFRFSVESEKLPAIQRVVKRRGLRFLDNPGRLSHHPSIYVSVGYDGDDRAEFAAACREIEEIRSPTPPPSPPRQGRLKNLLCKIRNGFAKTT